MRISAGHCRQLGATPEHDGVNFAIWARLASRVELLLFASADGVVKEVRAQKGDSLAVDQAIVEFQ